MMLTRLLALAVFALGLTACNSETAVLDQGPETPEPTVTEEPEETTDAEPTQDADEEREATFNVTMDPLAGAMLASFEAYVDQRLEEMGTTREETSVRHAVVDLSVPEPDWEQQGSLDVLVLYEGPGVCGTGGCTMDVATFSIDAEEFLQVGSIGLVKTPIRVARTVSENQHDLIVHVGGGGIEPYESLLQLTLGGETVYPTKADNGTRATQEQIDGAQVVLF